MAGYAAYRMRALVLDNRQVNGRLGGWEVNGRLVMQVAGRCSSAGVIFVEYSVVRTGRALYQGGGAACENIRR